MGSAEDPLELVAGQVAGLVAGLRSVHRRRGSKHHIREIEAARSVLVKTPGLPSLRARKRSGFYS